VRKNNRSLGVIDNLKHKGNLMTIYSAGLRISELVNLKIKNIDSQNEWQIRIQAKGKKDQNIPCFQKDFMMLRDYIPKRKTTRISSEGTR